MVSIDQVPAEQHAGDLPGGLDAAQALMDAARRRYDFDRGPAVALLDTCAEVGELAGAYLEDGGYASTGAGPLNGSEQVRSEYGDALFSPPGFGAAAGLSAGEALNATLARYAKRFAERAVEKEGVQHG